MVWIAAIDQSIKFLPSVISMRTKVLVVMAAPEIRTMRTGRTASSVGVIRTKSATTFSVS